MNPYTKQGLTSLKSTSGAYPCYSVGMRGFIALIMVLIILAIALTVGLGLGLLSISEAQMSLQKNQSSQAYYLANLCAEQALMKLKDTDGAYTGETLTDVDPDIENDTCTIEVEGSWMAKVTATSTNQVKKIKVVVQQINPTMEISSWQEVADF